MARAAKIMKICSLLPSGTEILFALGLGESVVGVTDLCDYPQEAMQRPVVSRSLIDSRGLSSAEVDEQMQALMLVGRSPFELDVTRLRAVKPDLVLTQDTCFRCDIDALDVERILAEVEPRPRMLVLGPRTVKEIFETIIEVGEAAEVPAAAQALVGELEERVQRVSCRAGEDRRRPTVLSLEGIDPLVGGGHWIPELKTLAGGRDELFTPGCDAQRLSWETLRHYDPEVLIISPCSSDLGRSLGEIGYLARQEGWWELNAVRTGEVYVVDHVYFSRPGPRVVQGLEILAQILHPALFTGLIPPHVVLKHRLPTGEACAPEALPDHFGPFP